MPYWSKEEWDSRKRYIDVEVSAGMFSCERVVEFSAGDRNYCLFVDESSLRDNSLEVYLIELLEDEAIIELPRDTFTSGTRVRVPRDMLSI